VSARHGGRDSRYVAGPANDGLEHMDGLPWYDTEIPRWWHLCWAQSRGWVNLIDWTRWCPCGATKVGRRGRWENRNSRLRETP
jgi:hypothetical protein